MPQPGLNLVLPVLERAVALLLAAGIRQNRYNVSVDFDEPITATIGAPAPIIAQVRTAVERAAREVGRGMVDAVAVSPHPLVLGGWHMRLSPRGYKPPVPAQRLSTEVRERLLVLAFASAIRKVMGQGRIALTVDPSDRGPLHQEIGEDPSPYVMRTLRGFFSHLDLVEGSRTAREPVPFTLVWAEPPMAHRGGIFVAAGYWCGLLCAGSWKHWFRQGQDGWETETIETVAVS